MIGLVIVSHSARLAEGVVELVAQMQPDLRVRAAGGMPDGSLGTSAETIRRALLEVLGPDGVLVLLDLGSAALSAGMAVDGLEEAVRALVVLSDAPLVEGAVLAAANAALGLSLAELAASIQEARRFPKDV